MSRSIKRNKQAKRVAYTFVKQARIVRAEKHQALVAGE